jgi:hypothetical protein
LLQPLRPRGAALYNWFDGLVGTLEVAQYQDASQDANLWKEAPCGWRPDPDMAAAYGLSYNPIPWCSGNFLITAFSSGPPVPSKSYFLAAALKNTYGNAVTSTPYGSSTLEAVQREAYLPFGYAAAPAVGLSAASSLATYQYFLTNRSGGMRTVANAMKQSADKAIRALGNTGGRSFTGAETIHL